MAKKPNPRDLLVRTAASLFRRRGYAATGLNEVVLESRTPKGSLYHYFPGGKEELAIAALEYAGEKAYKTLYSNYDSNGPVDHMVLAFGATLAGWVSASGFAEGCPVATTLLELCPRHAGVRAVGTSVFTAWVAVLCTSLTDHGVSSTAAQKLASVAVSAFEGALIQARTFKSVRPIDDVTDVLAASFRAAVLPSRTVGAGTRG